MKDHKKSQVVKKAIILANGDQPSLSEIRFFEEKSYNKFICADGGANSARRLNINPDLIIGDLDSITARNLKYFEKRCEIIEYNRQNDTDVEKALKYLIKRKYSDVILLGAVGNRLDHTICNLGIVLKFYSKIIISILYKRSFLTPVSGIVSLPAVKGETFSLYGFDGKTKITTTGLKYPVNNSALPFGTRESTSNVAQGASIELKISNGVIFIVRDFKLLKKHDLI